MPTPPDPAAAETIARAWYDTHARLAAGRRHPPTIWVHLAAHDRKLLIATAETLLAEGTIKPSTTPPPPAGDEDSLVDLDHLDALFARASMLPWDWGTHVPRNVYAGREPSATRGGVDIGRLDRAEDVRAMVTLVNNWPAISAELRERRTLLTVTPG